MSDKIIIHSCYFVCVALQVFPLHKVDSPVPPSGKGSSLFYRGITDDMRQQHRDRIFTVTKDDIVDVATRWGHA